MTEQDKAMLRLLRETTQARDLVSTDETERQRIIAIRHQCTTKAP